MEVPLYRLIVATKTTDLKVMGLNHCCIDIGLSMTRQAICDLNTTPHCSRLSQIRLQLLYCTGLHFVFMNLFFSLLQQDASGQYLAGMDHNCVNVSSTEMT